MSGAFVAANAGQNARPVTAKGYIQRSQLPWNALLFLLPPIIIYEVGTSAWMGSDQRIIAYNLMSQFFAWFGVYSRYLPALAVVTILLASHIARNDPWTLHGPTILGMAFESFLLAIPLFVGGIAYRRWVPMAASGNTQELNHFIASFGAGIYEELVFRLILFTVLSLLLVDVLKFRKSYCGPVIVLFSAFSFAAYHYLGSEPFSWSIFAFRSLAGAYFGVVYLYRGFGITAGSHASYDLIVGLVTLLR